MRLPLPIRFLCRIHKISDIVDTVPNAIQKLLNPQQDIRFVQQTCIHDNRNQFTQANDLEQEQGPNQETGNHDYDMSFDDKYIERQERGGRAINVNSISLKRFRHMLIEHFNFVFHQDAVLWPTRLTKKPRDVPDFTL